MSKSLLCAIRDGAVLGARALPALLAGLVLASWSAPALAQEPEFFDVPFAPEQWDFGRRLNESQMRYCVDPRDPAWEIAAEIADAVASGLLLEPVRYVVESDLIVEDLTKIYELLLKNCDLHMGFKLISEGYPAWLTITRPYYETGYVYVTADPELDALSDLARTRPIGATLGSSAHLALVAYLSAQPQAERWPTYPMGTDDMTLDALIEGRVDVALVWAPSIWGRQSTDPAFADLQIIEPAPLRPTTLGVGAVLLSSETFLRTAFDDAIAALIADGTIQAILDGHGFPATAGP